MQLSLYSGGNQLSRLIGSVVVITGAGRSGKTTIGNILGSCRNAEHFDDPWLLMSIPILAGNGLLPKSLAIPMFQTCLVELFYDRILMRHVNFRPEDLSSIWSQKSPAEIISRLMGLHSRDDVRAYAQDNRMTLVLTLANTLPYCDFFWAALPGCRVIHVLRDGLGVALEVLSKRWLSDDELLQPIHSTTYRPYVQSRIGATYHLPYWVEIGAEEKYLSSSEFGRCLTYWRRLMEMDSFPASGPECRRDFQVLKLADLLDHPQESIPPLLESLELTATEFTDRLIAKITRQEENLGSVDSLVEEEVAELAAVREICQRLGLPFRNIDRLLCAANR